MRAKGVILLGFISLMSCEDVVEIEVPAEEPRLIIDALIRIDEDALIVNPQVKVGLTSSFFEVIPLTNLQQITIVNIDQTGDNIVVLEEFVPNSGIYEEFKGIDFFTRGRLVFQVDHNDQLYLATTEYVRAPEIESLVQGDEFLLDEDETELRVRFSDNEETEDFYVFDFGEGNYFTTNDEFYQGQDFEFSYFYEEVLSPGEEFTVSILGADRLFYDYMSLLVDQSADDISVFDTPVATVRGNIFSTTELDNIDVFDNVGSPDNFPLGYFAVVQERKTTITIE